MAEDPWFKWYPKDCDSDELVRLMDDREFGFYVRLLNHSWTNRGLPESTESIAQAIGRTHKYVHRMWPKVSQRFSLKNGRLCNPRQEQEREKKNVVSLSRKKAAKSRWDANAYANAMHLQYDSSPSISSSSESSLSKEEQRMKDLYDFFCDEYSKVGEVPADLWQSFPRHVAGCAEKLASNLPLWVEYYQQSGKFPPNAVRFLREKPWLRKPPSVVTRTKSAMEGIE